jgi:hypothetical protein
VFAAQRLLPAYGMHAVFPCGRNDYVIAGIAVKREDGIIGGTPPADALFFGGLI